MGKSKTVMSGDKRKRVEGSPQVIMDGVRDDEVETRNVEAKKARVVAPPKRGVRREPAVLHQKTAGIPDPRLEDGTLAGFASGSLSLSSSQPSAPHQPPPQSQYPRHTSTHLRD